MAGLPVPKEYVRQQLQSMGLKDISEDDLEAYTRDFSQLIQDHLEHDSSSSSSSLGVSPHVGLQHNSSHDVSSSSTSTEVHTPLNTYHVQAPGSAVFKTFPGDKENRVQFLSPSISPKLSPRQVRSPGQDQSSSVLSTSNVRGGPPNSAVRRGVIKRKVLRKCNGSSKVFDESFSESGSPHVADLSGHLSDLSVTSTDTSSCSESRGGVHLHLPSSLPQHRPLGNKSFIRPATSHPHTRGLKKCDPVARYHEFKKLWENFQPPGEKDRSSLRWQIREQLMHQDIPPYEPKRRILKPNEFVVPTDKKRLALRWEIRHSLAQT